MASVGGIECTFLNDVNVPEEAMGAVASWRRPGMVGEGNQVVGAPAGTFRYKAQYFGTQVEVENWALAIQRLSATIVVIVDSWGNSYPNMLLKNVSSLRRIRADQGGPPRVRGTLFIGGTVVVQ